MQKFLSGLIRLLMASFLGGTGLFFQQPMSAYSDFNKPLITPTKITQSVNFNRHFQALGIKGSILIYDLYHFFMKLH